MVLSELFERFAKRSPVGVMIRATLEHALAPKPLELLFEQTALVQETRELLFSSCVNLMSLVVSGVHRSVHSAYQDSHEEIAVSVQALYQKLSHIEPRVSQALVRYSKARLEPILTHLGNKRPPLLPGYRIKLLDGNALAATEHRLKPLRALAAAPLPGKSLVVLDPEQMLAIDVFPCEDGHANERSLLWAVADTAKPKELWIGDRNFCTVRFLCDLHRRKSRFIIRQHKSMPFEEMTPLRCVGSNDDGMVWEQAVRLKDENGQELLLRRVLVKLETPTREGETEICLLTDLESVEADALFVAKLYRKRWTLENAFQTLATTMRAEINTLAYPKAALFGFCVALVAYNVLSVVKGALGAVHGQEKIEEISGYYLGDELAGVYRGMMIALPPKEWESFQTKEASEMAEQLRALAKNVNLLRYLKRPRGPKKPQPPRKPAKRHKHVSTVRILKQRNSHSRI